MRRSLFLIFPLLIAGCGGGGGSSSSSGSHRIGPVVRISWPARLRDVGAPLAATAARIVFPEAGKNETDLADTVARPTGAGAVTKDYTLGHGVTPGLHVLRVDFLASTDNLVPLAVASANVLVAADGTLQKVDGTPLGTISVESKVISLQIADIDPMEIGATVEPALNAYTQEGLAALKPGAVTFSVTAGGSVLQANANGTVTSLAAGTATIVPSVDGFTGTAKEIAVLPAAVAVRTIATASNDLRYDATRDRLWLALPASVSGGNSVRSLDVASGTLGTAISLGSEPTSLAISEDGSRMYVGFLTASVVRPIDLATNTALPAFALPPDQNGATVATDLAVQPGHPETVAVAPGESGFTQIGLSPVIFDNGVARPDGNVYSSGSRLIWSSASAIYSYTSSTPASTYSYSVGPTGVAPIRYLGIVDNDYLRPTVADGLIYNRSGRIFGLTNFTSAGAFSLNFQSFHAPAIDVTRHRAYFLELSARTVQIHAFDTDTRLETSVHRLGTTGVSVNQDARLVRVGASGLAFRLDDKVVLLDDISGY